MNIVYQPAFSVRPLSVREAKTDSPRIIVSSKISKKATERNLIKRRFREAWRMIAPPNHFAVSIYIKKPALKMSFAQIKAELARSFR